MRLCVFVETEMGLRILRFLLNNYPDHVKQVVVTKEWTEPDSLVLPPGCHYEIFDEQQTARHIRELEIDMVLLAWWPNILKKPVIEAARIGVINLHPSLLPHNRGKNYWFWNLVEDVPYGVSIHFVDTSVDGGDVLFQRQITKTWEDTGQTLFDKAKIEMLSLFAESYPKIASSDYQRTRQEPGQGSYHHSSELEAASELLLDQQTTARELLNRLRARTSKTFRQCYFVEDGSEYEVSIDIRKIS